MREQVPESVAPADSRNLWYFLLSPHPFCILHFGRGGA